MAPLRISRPPLALGHPRPFPMLTRLSSRKATERITVDLATIDRIHGSSSKQVLNLARLEYT
jgi:hypothetical protein